MGNFDLDFSCIEEFQKKVEKLGKKVSKIELWKRRLKDVKESRQKVD